MSAPKFSKTEIHKGNVRLWASGEIEHFDEDTRTWQRGWGPWASVSTVGEDERKFQEWKKSLEWFRQQFQWRG